MSDISIKKANSRFDFRQTTKKTAVKKDGGQVAQRNIF